MRNSNGFSGGVYVCGRLAVAALACLSLSAHAFDPYPTFTFGPGASAGSVTGSVVKGTAGGSFSVGASGATYSGEAKVLDLFKPSTKVTPKALFSPSNIGRGLVGGAAVAIPLLAAPIINALIGQACVRGFGGSLTLAPGGQWEECNFVKQQVQKFVTGSMSASTSTSMSASCTYWATHTYPQSTGVVRLNDPSAGINGYYCDAYGQGGGYINGVAIGVITEEGLVQDGYKPISAANAEAKIDQALQQWADAGDARLGEAVKNLWAAGQPVDGTLQVPTVETPVFSPPETTTKTMPDGKTETDTTTTKNDYSCTVIDDGKAISCTQYQTKTTTSTTVDPSTNTTTTSTTTTTKTNDPKEQAEDPCKANPDRLGCVPLGDPGTAQIPKGSVALTYSPESVLGSGSCPADKTMTLAATGKSIKAWDWAQSCSYITSYVKPVVLAVSAFIALMIVLPGVKAD